MRGLCDNEWQPQKEQETIRSLKVQLARLEDKYVGLRKSKNITDDPMSLPTPDLEVFRAR